MVNRHPGLLSAQGGHIPQPTNVTVVMGPCSGRVTDRGLSRHRSLCAARGHRDASHSFKISFPLIRAENGRELCINTSSTCSETFGKNPEISISKHTTYPLLTDFHSLIYSLIKWCVSSCSMWSFVLKTLSVRSAFLSHLHNLISGANSFLFSLSSSKFSAFVTSAWTLFCQLSLSCCGLCQKDFYLCFMHLLS